MFEEGTDEGYEVVVVGESAAVAGVGGAVVAAEGAAEGVDKDGRAFGGEPVVVAVAGVVATGNLRGEAVEVVDLLQLVDIRGGLVSIGVDHHQALLTSTEKVDIDKQLDLRESYQGVVDEVTAADKAAFLAAEKQEDVGVMASLEVHHAGKVHHGGGAAGVVVGTVEDGVAVHA